MKVRFFKYQIMSVREIVMGTVLLCMALLAYGVGLYVYVKDEIVHNGMMKIYMNAYKKYVADDIKLVSNLVLIIATILFALWLILFFLGKKKGFSRLGHFMWLVLFFAAFFRFPFLIHEDLVAELVIYLLLLVLFFLSYPIVAIVMAVMRRKKPEAFLSLADKKRKKTEENYRMLLEEDILTKSEYDEMMADLCKETNT